MFTGLDEVTPLDYVPNARCAWAVQAGGPITLSFLLFAIEANYDMLEVYEGYNPAPTAIPARTFHGFSMPQPVTMAGGMRLVFRSDSSVSAPGFVAQLSTRTPYMQSALGGMVTSNARVEGGSKDLVRGTTASSLVAVSGPSRDEESALGAGGMAGVAVAVAAMLAFMGLAAWRLRSRKAQVPPAVKGSASLPCRANADAHEGANLNAIDVGAAWFVRSEKTASRPSAAETWI
jgi:hypothetical protein